MNTRFFVMLGVASLLALLAAWGASRWIQGKTGASKDVSVVVAAVEVPFGVKLEDSHIKVINWPEKSVPKGAYSSKEQVINSVTLNKFYPDEIITDKRISKYLGGSTLSALIAKGSRAISVRVDDVVGVAGFVLPGNKVDILATKIDRSSSKATTRTLLENIKVLAVDQEASPEKEKPAIVRAVTLELIKEQAEIIVQAMQEGTIQLTLRNPLDSQVEVPPVKVVEELPKPVIQSAPVVQVRSVERKPIKKRVLKVISW